MGISTVVIITAVGLLLYYSAQIGYDLYMDNLATSNKDEDKEKAIDISDQAMDFQSVPVNNPHAKESKLKKLETLLMAGISADKMNKLMLSAAEGSPTQELEGMLYAIQNFQTEE